MHDELQDLKNLGKTSAQWLHAVGIHNAGDLQGTVLSQPIRQSSRGAFALPECSCTPSRAHC